MGTSSENLDDVYTASRAEERREDKTRYENPPQSKPIAYLSDRATEGGGASNAIRSLCGPSPHRRSLNLLPNSAEAEVESAPRRPTKTYGARLAGKAPEFVQAARSALTECPYLTVDGIMREADRRMRQDPAYDFIVSWALATRETKGMARIPRGNKLASVIVHQLAPFRPEDRRAKKAVLECFKRFGTQLTRLATVSILKSLAAGELIYDPISILHARTEREAFLNTNKLPKVGSMEGQNTQAHLDGPTSVSTNVKGIVANLTANPQNSTHSKNFRTSIKP